MNAQITIYTSGKTTQTRIYAGDFERLSQNGTTTSYLYIYSPDGLVGIYVKPSNGTAEMHYVVTDHLGSLQALYKANFTQTYAAAYDTWGKRTGLRESIKALLLIVAGKMLKAQIFTGVRIHKQEQYHMGMRLLIRIKSYCVRT